VPSSKLGNFRRSRATAEIATLLKSVAATFRRWRGLNDAGIVRLRTLGSEGTSVLNAPRPHSLRHEAVAVAFIVILLTIAVGAALRAW